MTVSLGLDIGGTNTRFCLLDGESVIATDRRPTDPQAGAPLALGRLVEHARRLADANGVMPAAVGIGITGPVDIRSGVVNNPHTLGGWPPTDVVAPFRAAFGVPVVVDNDANVAALGETLAGAARGCRRVVMVTLGTGVGVAVVIDGVVQRSAQGQHGEAGHMVIDPRGPECYCGARGCWEALVSGTAIGRRAREAFRGTIGFPGLEIEEGDVDHARKLFEADRRGDAAARTVVDDVADLIGTGLVNLAATVMPDVYIFAGSVALEMERLRPKIEMRLKKHALMIPTDVPIRGAALGDTGGAIGAAHLARVAASAD
jgi:glucokinase